MICLQVNHLGLSGGIKGGGGGGDGSGVLSNLALKQQQQQQQGVGNLEAMEGLLPPPPPPINGDNLPPSEQQQQQQQQQRKAKPPPPPQWKCQTSTQTIPITYKNDNYCDCIDGTDEPLTSACSNILHNNKKGGAIGGSGSGSGSYGMKFICGRGGGKIFPSRVDDGVCDCCDGSDERLSGFICADKCGLLRGGVI